MLGRHDLFQPAFSVSMYDERLTCQKFMDVAGLKIEGRLKHRSLAGESDVRTGSAGVIGRICVIGSQIKEDAVAEAFRV